MYVSRGAIGCRSQVTHTDAMVPRVRGQLQRIGNACAAVMSLIVEIISELMMDLVATDILVESDDQSMGTRAAITPWHACVSVGLMFPGAVVLASTSSPKPPPASHHAQLTAPTRSPAYTPKRRFPSASSGKAVKPGGTATHHRRGPVRCDGC